MVMAMAENGAYCIKLVTAPAIASWPGGMLVLNVEFKFWWFILQPEIGSRKIGKALRSLPLLFRRVQGDPVCSFSDHGGTRRLFHSRGKNP